MIMYFEKLKKYGKNIKMTSKMKEEIIYECSLAYNKEKRPKNKAFSIPKVRVLVAVACVLLILVGVRAVSRYDYSTAANNSNILIQNKIIAINPRDVLITDLRIDFFIVSPFYNIYNILIISHN